MSEGFIPFARPDIDEDDIAGVETVLRSGWLTTGPKTQEFEREFQALLGIGHALALNSCTAALHLSLEALGVGPGDEVITSPYTFAATGEVIRYLGAKPVFVDVRREDFNMDPERVRDAVTQRTRVLLPVHVAGKACDLDALFGLASEYSLAVVEDCAHALPARYQSQFVGTPPDRGRFPGIRGHAACFSFYATKTLTTGEGGMLCTDDPALAERARMMSLHGLSRDAWNRYAKAGSWYYEILAPGYKYNLTDIAASLGLSQLRKLEKMRHRREEIALTYAGAFEGLSELEGPKAVGTEDHAWHLYMLRLNLERLTIDRGRFITELAERGVGSSVHFIPLHVHPYYREQYGLEPEDLPVAHQEYQREVSLPIYSTMTDDEVERVTAAVRSIVGAHKRGRDDLR